MELTRKPTPVREPRVERLSPGPCVIGLDAVGCVRSWTRAAEVVFGHSHERALGLRLDQLAPFLAESPGDTEGWCRRVDGSLFRGMIGVLAPDDASAVLQGVVQSFVVTDVTARYVRDQAESRAQMDALQLSEAKLGAICDATSDGVMLVDADGKVLTLNGSALTLLRGAKGPLLHTPWYSVLGQAPALLPANGAFEVVCRNADGAAFTLECRVRAIGSDQTRLALIVMRDLSHHQQLERRVLDVSEQIQRQIGQDLHDGLGQLLTGTAFLTKGLQHSLGHEHQGQAQRIIELINQAITRVRTLARGLSPIHAGAQNLIDVLRHAVNEASELLGVTCELTQRDFIDTAQPAAIAQLCLITREAITNAVRHGQADHIVVHLSRDGEQSVLSVEDNGVGIGELVEGLGVRSMRYRAKIIGGDLDVARTHTGTTVRCLWPDP
jgi:two-component system sensor kinase FixL